MRRLLETISRVAPKDITLLISGETGTGKELIASLVHAQSQRASRPLVASTARQSRDRWRGGAVRAHARPFTGACRRAADSSGGERRHAGARRGRRASLPVQAKLLRVLQERRDPAARRRRVDKVDVRVVACTHRDLAEEARAGRFREDCTTGSPSSKLLVPPLREHRRDIRRSRAEFARRYAERSDAARTAHAELVDALQRVDWPGKSASWRTPWPASWRSARAERSASRRSRQPRPLRGRDGFRGSAEGTLSLREQLRRGGAQPDPPDDDGGGRQPVRRPRGALA